MTTEISPAEREGLSSRTHRNCIVCSSSNQAGFQLTFNRTKTGGVEGWFWGGRTGEGYTGLLHGGVIATLLDGAMTHCLFARGLVAMTTELKVRFREPVTSVGPVLARAWIDRSAHGLHVLEAELVQEGQVKATALGKFLEVRSMAESARQQGGEQDDQAP